MGLVVPDDLNLVISPCQYTTDNYWVLAGSFLVPMNALLQHRGYVTLSAGQSIAVQNFNENLNVLFMLVSTLFALCKIRGKM